MDVYPKKTNWKITCSPTFLAARFIAATIQEQPQCPSMAESINTVFYRHTRECYSAIKKKKNEIMPLAATYKELATITLSDVSLTEEDTHRGSPHG